VQPFLGVSESTPNFIRQEEEVEDILEVSLVDFLNENNVVTKKVTTSYATKIIYGFT